MDDLYEDDTLEAFTDEEIDAWTEALIKADEESTRAYNTTVERELPGNPEQLDEPVSISDRLETESGTVAENTTVEPDFEIPEPEPYVCPWADAPENTIFYEKMYEDGHLGSFTESAEMAYKFGWYENRISKDDVQQSDLNGWTYRKEVCPMKSDQDKQVELWNREIFELKEELSQTDYKAIKYAEGVMTDEEYQQTGIQRQAWRRRINELERLIAG